MDKKSKEYKAINHLREEYDRLITKVDSIAM